VNPQTLEEWQQYVLTLDADEAYNVAMAAGTAKFSSMLIEEGYVAKDVTAILTMIALRLQELDVAPPRVGKCVVDFRWLASGKVIEGEDELSSPDDDFTMP
jgi:hypothetical protein